MIPILKKLFILLFAFIIIILIHEVGHILIILLFDLEIVDVQFGIVNSVSWIKSDNYLINYCVYISGYLTNVIVFIILIFNSTKSIKVLSKYYCILFYVLFVIGTLFSVDFEFYLLKNYNLSAIMLIVMTIIAYVNLASKNAN